MYSKDFYITDRVGNNAFSYEQRTNKKLFVPKLKKINSLGEIKLGAHSREKTTFEDYNFNGELQSCYGLKNLYEYNSLLNPLSFQKKGDTRPIIYIVDNHNHVFYFWYLARSQRVISDNAILYHIDEHADMRDPGEYLLKTDSHDIQKVFKYTNFTLNVGNYIIPAQKEGLIKEVVQIRGEGALIDYLQTPSLYTKSKEEHNKQSIILNLDLDFFQLELDYINYELKKKVILDIAKKADLITICTSPFFIEQERALRVLKDLFTPSASQPQ